MQKIKYLIIALVCMAAQGLVLTACSNDNEDNSSINVESPETDEYKVFDDLSYFQRAIVQMDPLGRFLYFHYGKVLYPNDRGHLFIGVNTWDEAEKIFRSWMAPDVVLRNVGPSTRALKGELTDTLGNAQLTVYLEPSEGTNVAECTVSDDTQIGTSSSVHSKKPVSAPSPRAATISSTRSTTAVS